MDEMVILILRSYKRIRANCKNGRMRLADAKVNVVYRFPAARRGFRVLKMLRDH